MDKVKFINIEDSLTGETNIHAIVTLSEDSYESMPKAEYDRRQAEAALSTPMVTVDEAEAI